MTHYQRPGLVPLATPGSPAVGRGLYQASNGDCYMVVGSTVYFVDYLWNLHSLGSIDNLFGNPVSMVDNGTDLVIVDGVPYAGNAVGDIVFGSNPSNGDTATLNGVVWTFVTGTPTGNEIQIGGTCSITITLLANALNASANPALDVAYSLASGGPDSCTLYVVYKYPGAIGTAYTLAASAGTPSGGNLALGSTVPPSGWTVALGSLSGSAVTAIDDTSWTGADRVDYIDTFVIWNAPGTGNFWSSNSNEITPITSTFVARKTGWPDPLQGVIVCREQVLLMGTQKSELWYDAGNATFPFARLPGTSIIHGAVSKYSLATADINIYWLSADLQGQGVVLRQRNNETKRISNYALEFAIRQMTAAGITIADAVGYTYLQDGHLFYVLSFPSGNQTWVWDESVSDPEQGWHQRCWTDSSGNLNRYRGAFGANFYGVNVVQDWQNGTLYQLSPSAYTDTVGGQQYPITYLRTFPHLMVGKTPDGQPVLSNGHMVQHDRFQLDAECGNALPGPSPNFSLRWSDDRGKSWGNPVPLVAGAQGQYGTRPDLRSLGQAMDRVYELSWTFQGQVALNGAWVEGRLLNQ